MKLEKLLTGKTTPATPVKIFKKAASLLSSEVPETPGDIRNAETVLATVTGALIWLTCNKQFGLAEGLECGLKIFQEQIDKLKWQRERSIPKCPDVMILSPYPNGVEKPKDDDETLLFEPPPPDEPDDSPAG